MKPLLSILIPTIKEREQLFESLRSFLTNELVQELGKEGWNGFISPPDRPFCISGFSKGWVEVMHCEDQKQMTIGEKRELLYFNASGEYSIQIDDDDTLAPGSIKKIISALECTPDCVTFLERCEMNGRSLLANHSLRYDDWADNKDGFDFVRTPFYKDVIRTDIARSVPFDHIRYGEDHAWSRALKPHLKTEVHIDDIIYIYQHNSKPEDHNKRYGIVS